MSAMEAGKNADMNASMSRMKVGLNTSLHTVASDLESLHTYLNVFLSDSMDMVVSGHLVRKSAYDYIVIL